MTEIKCPECGSKKVSLVFHSKQSLIFCQNNKEMVCEAFGHYGFLSYPINDPRFGQVIKKIDLASSHAEDNQIIDLPKKNSI